MITKQKIVRTKDPKVRVTFKMPALDGCNCLYLVGKFNDSNESVFRMQRADDGTWFLALELESGRDYQYRYRTDNGIWHTDPVAKSHVPQYDGSPSSVLSV
jgi:1,4-alpha-glucan branching enzyme